MCADKQVPFGKKMSFLNSEAAESPKRESCTQSNNKYAGKFLEKKNSFKEIKNTVLNENWSEILGK